MPSLTRVILGRSVSVDPRTSGRVKRLFLHEMVGASPTMTLRRQAEGESACPHRHIMLLTERSVIYGLAHGDPAETQARDQPRAQRRAAPGEARGDPRRGARRVR